MIIKMENYFIATHSYPYKCYDKIILYPNNIFYKQTKKILHIVLFVNDTYLSRHGTLNQRKLHGFDMIFRLLYHLEGNVVRTSNIFIILIYRNKIFIFYGILMIKLGIKHKYK